MGRGEKIQIKEILVSTPSMLCFPDMTNVSNVSGRSPIAQGGSAVKLLGRKRCLGKKIGKTKTRWSKGARPAVYVCSLCTSLILCGVPLSFGLLRAKGAWSRGVGGSCLVECSMGEPLPKSATYCGEDRT